MVWYWFLGKSQKSIEILCLFVYNNPNVGVYTNEWKGVPS